MDIQQVKAKSLSLCRNILTGNQLTDEIRAAAFDLYTLWSVCDDRIVALVNRFGVTLSLDSFVEIQSLLSERRKIAAIKLLRSMTTLALKEAKEAIESDIWVQPLVSTRGPGHVRQHAAT